MRTKQHPRPHMEKNFMWDKEWQNRLAKMCAEQQSVEIILSTVNTHITFQNNTAEVDTKLISAEDVRQALVEFGFVKQASVACAQRPPHHVLVQERFSAYGGKNKISLPYTKILDDGDSDPHLSAKYTEANV